MQVYLMRRQGKTFKEIGKAVGVSGPWASKIYQNLVRRMVKTQQHKFQNISQRNQFIRMQIKAGVHISAVATSFQLSESRIREIARTAY